MYYIDGSPFGQCAKLFKAEGSRHRNRSICHIVVSYGVAHNLRPLPNQLGPFLMSRKFSFAKRLSFLNGSMGPYRK